MSHWGNRGEMPTDLYILSLVFHYITKQNNWSSCPRKQTQSHDRVSRYRDFSVALHLDRFIQFFTASDGHDRISISLKRDVLASQRALQMVTVEAARENLVIGPLL